MILTSSFGALDSFSAAEYNSSTVDIFNLIRLWFSELIFVWTSITGPLDLFSHTLHVNNTPTDRSKMQQRSTGLMQAIKRSVHVRLRWASSNFPFSLLPSPTNLQKSKCQNACKHKVHTNEFMVPLKIHAKIAKKSLIAVLLVSYHSLILLFNTPFCN